MYLWLSGEYRQRLAVPAAQVLNDVRNHLRDDHTIVSIAAGITVERCVTMSWA
jgi:pyrroline-5-carboxylate reductase